MQFPFEKKKKKAFWGDQPNPMEWPMLIINGSILFFFRGAVHFYFYLYLIIYI